MAWGGPQDHPRWPGVAGEPPQAIGWPASHPRYRSGVIARWGGSLTTPRGLRRHFEATALASGRGKWCLAIFFQ
jgi:hypothetical protein